MRRVFLYGVLALASVCAALVFMLVSSTHAAAQQQQAVMEPDQVSDGFALDFKAGTLRSDLAAAGSGGLGRRSNGSLLGVDSLSNFSSYFYFPGVIDRFGDPQFTWPYTMVGRAPFGR